MATRKQYGFVTRVINKITRNETPNNTSFYMYGHYVSLQSGTRDYVDVTIYKGDCNFTDILISFDYDFWLNELNISESDNDVICNRVIEEFKKIYGKIKVFEDE